MIQIILFLVAACNLVLADFDLLVKITAGSSKVGVYFPGFEPETENPIGHFLTAVKPNETVYEGIKFGTPLVFIADDFRTRINVYFVDERDTSLDTPYSMSFHNLASGDRGGSVPVELKHSTSGYIWIEGGQHVSHFTAERHPFTIYDNHKNEIFTVSIMPPAKEDL